MLSDPTDPGLATVGLDQLEQAMARHTATAHAEPVPATLETTAGSDPDLLAVLGRIATALEETARQLTILARQANRNARPLDRRQAGDVL